MDAAVISRRGDRMQTRSAFVMNEPPYIMNRAVVLSREDTLEFAAGDQGCRSRCNASVYHATDAYVL